MSKSPNLSPVSFDAWLTILFDQRVSSGNGLAYRYDYRVSDASRLVAHMTRLCREFRSVSKRFSARQINQGVWFLLGCDFGFGAYLADPEIDLEARIACVRAMIHPCSNYVTRTRKSVIEGCFEMWWDMLCGSFWSANLQRIKRDEIEEAMERDMEAEGENGFMARAQFYAELDIDGDFDQQLAEAGLTHDDLETECSKISISYAELEHSQRCVADAMLETLTQTLYLEDEFCEYFALHGLNHLRHPGGGEIIESFIRTSRHRLVANQIAYARKCRDGEAM